MVRSPETRLFGRYWEDGLLDLVAGGAACLIGIGYVLEQHLVSAVVVPLALVGWLILRGRVVEPRAGYVEFSRFRREKSERELAGAFWVGAGGLGLVLAGILWWRDGLVAAEAVDALPGLLVALMAIAASALTCAWRFAGYGALLAGASVATVLLSLGPGLPLVVGGLVAVATGAVLLARFVAGSRQFAESE